jgi:Flp pilus assembly protein TadG
LRRATSANVTVTFALAVLPMAGFVGAAVDYSRANSVKAAMQAAADSTALMLSKTASKLSDTSLDGKADEYFRAVFHRPAVASALKVSATYSTASGSQVTVDASTKVQTNFMRIMGFSELTVAVTAQARWGTTKMQIALALDNTGSMAENLKMPALKTATKALLTTLQGLATNAGDVRVAIIPFAEHVNVGKDNWNEKWVDWEDWDDDNGQDVSTTTCKTYKTGKSGKKKKKCETSTTWVPDDHKTWNGCVTDRDQDHDIKNTSPDDKKDPGSLFPAEQSDSCPTKLKALSHDFTSLAGLVDLMKSDGFTNQPIGLAWAWMALTQGKPLNAPAKGADISQAIVLFSDGLNTKNRWTDDPKEIDARQAKMCENIKKAQITIYTVLVGAGFSKVMRDCASQPDFYYEISNPGDTITAFNDIGTKLSKLRIAN